MCKRDIQLLGAKLQRIDRNSAAGLREAIRIIRIFMRWWDRAPNICFQKVPPKSQLELMKEEYEKRLRDLNRRR
jgi:hypothetical protein